MKLAAVVLVTAAAAAAPHRADACGTLHLGDYVTTLGEALDGTHESLSVPTIQLSAGTNRDGSVGSLTAGWSWGDRQIKGLFPGIMANRVLVDINRTFSHRYTDVALTYGWFDNHLISLAFDAGVSTSLAVNFDAGPTARVSVGYHGIGVRLDATGYLAPDPRVNATAQLVVDLTEMTGRI